MLLNIETRRIFILVGRQYVILLKIGVSTCQILFNSELPKLKIDIVLWAKKKSLPEKQDLIPFFSIKFWKYFVLLTD